MWASLLLVQHLTPIPSLFTIHDRTNGGGVSVCFPLVKAEFLCRPIVTASKKSHQRNVCLTPTCSAFEPQQGRKEQKWQFKKFKKFQKGVHHHAVLDRNERSRATTVASVLGRQTSVRTSSGKVFSARTAALGGPLFSCECLLFHSREDGEGRRSRLAPALRRFARRELGALPRGPLRLSPAHK